MAISTKFFIEAAQKLTEEDRLKAAQRFLLLAEKQKEVFNKQAPKPEWYERTYNL